MTANRSFPAILWNPTAENLENQKDDLIEWGDANLPKTERIVFIDEIPHHAANGVFNKIKENDWLVLITPENELVIFPDAHVRKFFVIE
jgi:hypothetical protein